MQTVKTVNELSAHLELLRLKNYQRTALSASDDLLLEYRMHLRKDGSCLADDTMCDIQVRMERRILRAITTGIEEMNLHSTPIKVKTTERNYKLPVVKG